MSGPVPLPQFACNDGSLGPSCLRRGYRGTREVGMVVPLRPSCLYGVLSLLGEARRRPHSFFLSLFPFCRVLVLNHARYYRTSVGFSGQWERPSRFVAVGCSKFPFPPTVLPSNLTQCSYRSLFVIFLARADLHLARWAAPPVGLHSESGEAGPGPG